MLQIARKALSVMMTSGPRPEISVIVPVFEQWGMAATLLKALAAQRLDPQRFEILLIDNGSSDFSPPEVLPTNSRLLVCRTPGSYAARAYGVSQARGVWLAFTDADCQPDEAWLTRLLEVQEARQDPELLIAGDIRMKLGSSQRSPWAIYDYVKGIPQQEYVRRGYAATANLFVSRAVYDRVGGFDIQRFSGGDADFCRRALACGAQLVFEPSAFVWHPVRETWQELATKARRIKGGQQHGVKAYGGKAYGSKADGAWLRLSRLLRQAYWLSPLALFRRMAALLGRQHAPLAFRLVAVAVCILVWGVELSEAARLAVGGRAERR